VEGHLSFKVGGQECGSGAVLSVGSTAKPLVEVWGSTPPEADNIFLKICHFKPVLRNMHDDTNRFNTKSKKNQFEGRKVVGQATMLAH